MKVGRGYINSIRTDAQKLGVTLWIAMAPLCVLTLATLVYRWWGPDFVAAVYYGTSISWLNSFVSGQARTPLAYYIGKADEVFFHVWLFSLPGAFLWMFTVRLIGNPQRRSKKKFQVDQPPVKTSLVQGLALVTGGLMVLLVGFLAIHHLALSRVGGYVPLTEARAEPLVYPKLSLDELRLLGWGQRLEDAPWNSYLFYPEKNLKAHSG